MDYSKGESVLMI